MGDHHYNTIATPYKEKEITNYQQEIREFIKPTLQELRALKINNFDKKYKNYV